MTIECDFVYTENKIKIPRRLNFNNDLICVTILLSMIFSVFKILINLCISNTRGRSQTETSTNSIFVLCIFAIKQKPNMWIKTNILPEVQFCTCIQVSHF